MSEIKNYGKVEEIAGTHLGKIGGAGYSDTYDPTLLVAVPRVLNREAYGIQEEDLPFTGVDVWNAYEVSAITTKGRPVSGMMKIVYPADSRYHVESKSLKLYLNSFNMTTLGDTEVECMQAVEQRVSGDLSKLLETEVQVKMHTTASEKTFSVGDNYTSVDAHINLDTIEFTQYKSDASQLKTSHTAEDVQTLRIHSDLLRSNCRVTNQPDWGDIFIHIEGKNIPDITSLVKYIVSHRKVSHFHEEICEMTFTHLTQAYSPEKLMVTCLYTRRGGIDINPCRASHADLIWPEFKDETIRVEKTLRQ